MEPEAGQTVGPATRQAASNELPALRALAMELQPSCNHSYLWQLQWCILFCTCLLHTRMVLRRLLLAVWPNAQGPAWKIMCEGFIAGCHCWHRSPV